jgi:hypothetical protein
MRYIFPMSISVVTVVAARPAARSVMPRPAAVIAAANRARRQLPRRSRCPLIHLCPSTHTSRKGRARARDGGRTPVPDDIYLFELATPSDCAKDHLTYSVVSRFALIDAVEEPPAAEVSQHSGI